ncbi:MAG TPA: ribonuclease Z [Candidatus Nanoarchaeia archaeon]|nr:ribonuclease Z [Candidatus Nanoarchaeia archaeon]
MIKVTFLGTSCMMPTPERNHPAVLLSWKGENILVDCGENTQRQLRIAGIPPTAVTKILLTHWHGDHMLGLPGLLQSMIACQYRKVLEIYGPKGTKKNLEMLMNFLTMQNEALKIKVSEIVEDGIIFRDKEFHLEAVQVKHSAPCVAYAFQEFPRRKINLDYTKKLGIPEGPLLGKLQQGKDIQFRNKTIKSDKATYLIEGKRIAYITDTSLVDACYKIAKSADLLVCESTFSKTDEEKARETHHLTAVQAATIAKKAKYQALAIMHFSQRYKTAAVLLKEARSVFKNARAMNDFDAITI